MRSPYFCKLDFDNSNNSKIVSNKKKREYGSYNGNKEYSSLQERLQTSVEVIKNCHPPPPTPKMLGLLLELLLLWKRRWRVHCC
jgi:hypothetical protein